MKIPVEGHIGLYRDENTNAIINCNTTEYDDYMRIKNKLISDQAKINSLECDIAEIKCLLNKITENK